MSIFLRILEKWACRHTWREQIHLTTKAHPNDGDHIIKHTMIYACSECGKFKKLRLE